MAIIAGVLGITAGIRKSSQERIRRICKTTIEESAKDLVPREIHARLEEDVKELRTDVKNIQTELNKLSVAVTVTNTNLSAEMEAACLRAIMTLRGDAL